MALRSSISQKKIHEKYLSKNEILMKFLMLLKNLELEAKGSEIFKGIKSNIFKKHKYRSYKILK